LNRLVEKKKKEIPTLLSNAVLTDICKILEETPGYLRSYLKVSKMAIPL